MKFNLEDYEPVEDRIKRFYKDHVDGRITTELLSDANNMETAVVKAFIYVAEELKATGLAYEKNGEGYVNKTSHLENCETSAIGRGLANFNYAGNKRPSREEMTKGDRGAKEVTTDIKENIVSFIDENKDALDEDTIEKADLYVSGDHSRKHFEEALASLKKEVESNHDDKGAEKAVDDKELF